MDSIYMIIIRLIVALMIQMELHPNIQAAVLSEAFESYPATIVEQAYEGYAEYDDVYVIELESGARYSVVADDYRVGDRVIVWIFEGEVIRMMLE